MSDDPSPDWSAHPILIWSYKSLIGQIPRKSTDSRKSTDDVIRLYISKLFNLPSSVLVVISMKIVTEQTSPEESRTRYMLPEQVDAGGTGLVDYFLNVHSPARCPIATNKKKRKS